MPFRFYFSSCPTIIYAEYHLHYRTTEVKCHNKLPSSPEYHFFDLKEFARIFRKSSGEITNRTDYWLSLLIGSKEMDGMPNWAEGDKAYEAYFEASAVSNFMPQESLKIQTAPCVMLCTSSQT
jgi:hypothetical protein